MVYKSRPHPNVEIDINEAVDELFLFNPNYAESFVSSVQAAFDGAVQSPESWPSSSRILLAYEIAA